MHARLSPRKHRFEYGVFMLWLDLDEFALIEKSVRLLGINRAGLFSFAEADHIRTSPDQSLKENVIAYAREQGITEPVDRVRFLVLPKVLGYLFHPFSAFFLYAADGRVLGSIAQVTNTFLEQKWFWIPLSEAPETSAPLLRWRGPKHFYVSPFSDVDVEFEFKFRPPGATFHFSVDDWTKGEKTLVTTFRGTRAPLTDGNLLWFFVTNPLLTLRVITLIHWHALLLYLKRIPYFAKAARPELQRDVHRPHVSIAPKT
jgi:DUF1365 family protein